MKESPIFEFYAYCFYKKRGEEVSRAKIFKVYAPGHAYILELVRPTPESKEIDLMVNRNEVSSYFRSVRRKGSDDHGQEMRGKVEFVCDMEMKQSAVDFFIANRVSIG